LKTITHLQRASAFLGYDQLVFMPQHADTSIEHGAQMAALASVIHKTSTNPKLLEWMDQAMIDLNNIKDEDGDANNGLEEEASILELEHKSFLETQCVPTELASKAAMLSSSAYSAWVNARKASDFSMFAPILQGCFETSMAINKAKRGDTDHSLPKYQKGHGRRVEIIVSVHNILCLSQRIASN
jgi:carboxypeptidase Taq